MNQAPKLTRHPWLSGGVAMLALGLGGATAEALAFVRDTSRLSAAFQRLGALRAAQSGLHRSLECLQGPDAAQRAFLPTGMQAYPERGRPDSAASQALRQQIGALDASLQSAHKAVLSEASAALARTYAKSAAFGLLSAFSTTAAFFMLAVALRRSERRANRLSDLALHDALTALPNRRYLLDWLGRRVAESRRSGQPLSVFYIDLDGFKSVNDRFGHRAGDALLKAAAARLQARLRASDLIGRVGGDEFVAVATGAATPEATRSLAQSLAHAFDEPLLPALPRLRISASVGVARYPDDGTSATALIDAADAAMYLAKRRGKHTYEVASRARPPVRAS